MVREYTKDTTADELVKDLAGEIANKVVLVTGVSQGTLGGIFLEYIVKANPSRLILAGRTLSKTQQTADALKAAHPNIDIRTLQVDLSSLADVREAAAKVNSWEDVPHIDVLVNNAGIMAIPYQVTVDGFEMQFGSNHLGPFLFTNLIMDKILASKAPRIVNVSSSGHRLNPIRFFDYNFGVCLPPQSLQRLAANGGFPGRRNVQQMAGLRPVQDSQHAHGRLSGGKAGLPWSYGV
jgi:NAD(P)-dependent dehydrogenase (short-subunit alcohol dehydrogenase family)